MKDAITLIFFLLGAISVVMLYFRAIDPLIGKKGHYGYHPYPDWVRVVGIICFIIFIILLLFH